MKNFRFYTIALFALFALISSPAARAQSDTTKTDTLGTALLAEFNNDLDVAFKAVKAGLTNAGYIINYDSKKRRLVETEFKILATEDNFHDVMNLYGDVPYMRSPGWTTGRARITVNFEVIDSAKTAVKVLAQLSGYEERFTNRWHYWNSNGKIEEEAMAAIEKAIEAVKE